jgi:hypothetical protein
MFITKVFLIPVLAITSLSAQTVEPAPPPLLYSAFLSGGPIASGTVAAVDTSGGVLTLTVNEQLRGKPLGNTILVPYSPPSPNLKRPPEPWDGIDPVPGKQLMLFLAGEAASWEVREVLDLTGEQARWVPVIRRMIEMESDKVTKQSLLNDVTDSSQIIRALATKLLTDKVCVSDLSCKQEILNSLRSKAEDAKTPSPRRVESVQVIGTKLYDGFSADDPINQVVLKTLLEFTASADERVRAEAIQIASGYLLGAGSSKPKLPPLTSAQRNTIIAQLQMEGRQNSSVAGQANALAHLLSGQ